MIDVLALTVVVLAGLYFVALAATSLFFPARASRFLLGFATTAPKHYSEMLLRVAVGAALILNSPRMLGSSAFSLFGWLLLVTTAGLLLVPWRWHHRFAQHVVPMATRHITLVGLVSLVIGGLMLVAVARGGVGPT